MWDKEIRIVDLPGIYPLPYTSEIVTRDFTLNEQPDVILNIVDATNTSAIFIFIAADGAEADGHRAEMMDEVNRSGNHVEWNS
ncbi:MAG: FeoB small GTPase domain-containing protein [Merdibacter sp.]